MKEKECQFSQSLKKNPKKIVETVGTPPKKMRRTYIPKQAKKN
jgi:hypothetical protein